MRRMAQIRKDTEKMRKIRRRGEIRPEEKGSPLHSESSSRMPFINNIININTTDRRPHTQDQHGRNPTTNSMFAQMNLVSHIRQNNLNINSPSSDKHGYFLLIDQIHASQAVADVQSAL
ncbi:hypothetical protein MAR_038076 [Mya arenaria]|uniref:Uncharacterized protein n=1 Tax=Mya arenaria TaxID=6604 RepID=A0ABY7FS41_MYAAR|nr:hypothetical protein MAR_038076 [Mya arenaria]